MTESRPESRAYQVLRAAIKRAEEHYKIDTETVRREFEQALIKAETVYDKAVRPAWLKCAETIRVARVAYQRQLDRKENK